jgi:ribose transport system substrate-binding protein
MSRKVFYLLGILGIPILLMSGSFNNSASALAKALAQDATPTTEATTAGGTGYSGAPRPFLWSPVFHQIVDTSQYKKDGPYVIGFSNASISNIWRVALLHSVQYHAFLHKDEIEQLIITDANDDPAKQVADIQDLMQQGVDLLIVSAAQSAALDPIVTRATEQGIPVVMVDRRVDSENFVTFVTASDLAIGRFQAQWIVEKLGGKGNVIMLSGIAGASPAELRIQAAKEVFAQYPEITILENQYADWSPAKGKEVMSAMIQKYGQDINAVWSDHGLQGSGSIEAFIEAGYEDGTIPPHTGADLNAQLKLAVEHQVPIMWLNYPPAMGGVAVDVAVQVLKGAGVPKTYEINADLVVSKGDETASVKADVYAEDYVKMDQSGDLILSSGIPDYDPNTFEVDYPQ